MTGTPIGRRTAGRDLVQLQLKAANLRKRDKLRTHWTYSSINPGETAYEGVYVAYYILSGEEIDPDALGGKAGNTFLYDYPVITNENLEELLEKIDTFREGGWGSLELPPMTPEEILEKWFLE